MPAPRRSSTGRAKTIGTQQGLAARVRISLANNSGLKVGTFARASIDAKRSCGVAVPRTAIDHLTVQVVKWNTVETRRVRVGLTSETSTEILEGIEQIRFKPGSGAHMPLF